MVASLKIDGILNFISSNNAFDLGFWWLNFMLFSAKNMLSDMFWKYWKGIMLEDCEFGFSHVKTGMAGTSLVVQG